MANRQDFQTRQNAGKKGRETRQAQDESDRHTKWNRDKSHKLESRLMKIWVN